MRELIQIVEGDIVPFPTKPAVWTDHGDDMRSKPFTVGDLFGGDEPPEPIESIDVTHSAAAKYEPAVEVRWYDWMRAFSAMDINRLLKMQAGDEFEAVDMERRPNPGFPLPRWMVKRESDRFIIGYTYWSTTRDDAGKEQHDVAFGWKRYGLPISDLQVAFQRLKSLMAKSRR